MATTDRSEDVLGGGDDGAVGGEGEGDDFTARVGLRYTLKQVMRDPTAVVGLGIVGVATAVAIFAFVDAEFLSYWFANTFWVNPENDPSGTVQVLLPPGFSGIEIPGLGWELPGNIYYEEGGTWEHPLGTDHRGRDMLVRMFYGTKIAMMVGYSATFIGLVGGTLVGAVAGYYGDWVDDVLMRAAETLYAIPFLVLVLAVMAALGRRIEFAIIGVGIASIPTFARLIRSRVFSVREEDYIEAARAAGVRDRNIILRHIIPNSFAPVLVQATLQVGVSIIVVAGLSFLGFGVQPPEPSWGQMLSQSRNTMLQNWWFSFWPGLAILITVVGFNLFGDGLRDALDPRVSNR